MLNQRGIPDDGAYAPVSYFQNNLSNVAGHKMNADVNDVPSDGNNTKQSHDVTDHIVIQGSVINPRGFDALRKPFYSLNSQYVQNLVYRQRHSAQWGTSQGSWPDSDDDLTLMEGDTGATQGGRTRI